MPYSCHEDKPCSHVCKFITYNLMIPCCFVQVCVYFVYYNSVGFSLEVKSLWIYLWVVLVNEEVKTIL